ncbi:MAG: DoxX family protein [Fimbriiglobus sp.]
MKYLTWLIQGLLGLVFVVFGANFFLKFIPIPEGQPESAITYLTVLASSGYLTAIKILEIVGGLLTWTTRFTPLGLVILVPIIVNIAFFEVYLVGKPGIAFVLLGFAAYLMIPYRAHFLPFFFGISKEKNP